MVDSSAGIVRSRYLDSATYKCEGDVVHYWMGTKKTLLTTRDHPQSGIEISGEYNLTRATQNFELMVKNAKKRTNSSEAKKEDDKFLLERYLWLKVKYDSIQQNSYLYKSYPRSIPNLSQSLTNYDVIGSMGGNVVLECLKDWRPKEHSKWLYFFQPWKTKILFNTTNNYSHKLLRQ